MKGGVTCPGCGRDFPVRIAPFPTTDILIRRVKDGEEAVVLVRRRNPPHGWAIPGGFIEYGESAEACAVREAEEETGLRVKLAGLLGVYSDPKRDPRFHTISAVYTAEGEGEPRADSDAAEIGVFTRDELPPDIAFDHRAILEEYFRRLMRGSTPPAPLRPAG
ncbi:MAG: NUDIX hydrolase [Chlamydiota bacterium]